MCRWKRTAVLFVILALVTGVLTVGAKSGGPLSVPSVKPVFAEAVQPAAYENRIELRPDVETVYPGGTVHYEIVLTHAESFGTFQLQLDIPAGMTLVTSSVPEVDDKMESQRNRLGFDFCGFNPDCKFFNGYASEKDFKTKAGEEVVLMTFDCTVGDNVEPGTVLTVTATDLEVASVEDWNDHTSVTELGTTGVTVKAVPWGDVNGDGRVDVSDVVYLKRYLVAWSGYEKLPDPTASDLNRDGRVDITDVVILKRHLVRWDGYVTLPIANK